MAIVGIAAGECLNGYPNLVSAVYWCFAREASDWRLVGPTGLSLSPAAFSSLHEELVENHFQSQLSMSLYALNCLSHL